MSEDPTTKILEECLISGSVIVVGEIPVIGGVAAAILDKIFATDKEAKDAKALVDMENRMKNYSQGLVDAAHLASIRALVAGHRANLKSYVETKPTEKGDKLNYLASKLEGDYATMFTEDDNPERHYLFFLTFATLHLAILRDLAYHFKEAFTDPKTGVLKEDDNNHEKHVKDLFDYQAKYIENLGHIKDRLMEWRLNNISDPLGEESWPTLTGNADTNETIYDFEYHDTVLGKSFKGQGTDGRASKPADQDSIRSQMQGDLDSYRKNMTDQYKKSFPDANGLEVESYAYHLAQEMKVASLWKDFCFPRGGALPEWIAVRLEEGEDSAQNVKPTVLAWRYRADTDDEKNEKWCYIDQYLSWKESGPEWVEDYDDGRYNPWEVSRGLILVSEGGGPQALEGLGHRVVIADRLVVEDGKLVPIDPVPAEWTWGL